MITVKLGPSMIGHESWPTIRPKILGLKSQRSIRSEYQALEMRMQLKQQAWELREQAWKTEVSLKK